ncbi:MAG: YraN family protein [Spirochaetaceae bacterium]|nr:YraN family protein [Spirochaetaceae bacterium]
MESTKSIGVKGEERAVLYLKEKGYEIIQRNWRTRTGEVDIIALKESFLVFVEVKTMPHGTTDTLTHILGTIKQKRIVETAKYFLLKYRQYNDSYIRFDVVVVDMPGYVPIYHLENAFSE